MFFLVLVYLKKYIVDDVDMVDNCVFWIDENFVINFVC